MSETYKPQRTIDITPVATLKTVLGADGASTYAVGTAGVTQTSASVDQNASANWRRQQAMAPPMKFAVSGASAVEEYLATAKHATTGALTLERVYAEVTDAAAAYTLSKIKQIDRYVVHNDVAGSADMKIWEVNLAGEISAVPITVLSGEVYRSPFDVAILGIQYQRVSADGAARVFFYEKA